MTCNLLWKFLGVAPLLVLTLLGCAGSMANLKQEISDDRRTIRQNVAEREYYYEKRQYLGFSSDKPEDWNSTDWSLWVDTQGGGR